MARGSNGNLRESNEWVKNLRSRVAPLEEEEKEWEKSEPSIYRVDPSLRELKADQFNSTILPLGLVSNTKRSTQVQDTLKLDVGIKFLADTGQSPEDWTNVSEDVVRDPEAIKRLYNEEFHLSVDDIRSILAQDAIFLACFLIHFFQCEAISMLQETNFFFSRQSRRLRLVLFKEICKLENQIPLALIKNVIVIIFRCHRNISEQECQYKATKTLANICSEFVSTLITRFPSFQFPKAEETFDTSVPAKGIISRFVGIMLGRLRRSPGNGSPYAHVRLNHSEGAEISTTDIEAFELHRCQHLLHCFAHVLWNEAKVNKSNNHPRSHSLWDHHLPTAKELHKHGVQIQGHEDFHPKLVRHTFFPWRATLFLPQIGAIDEDTEEIWRNLLAFEDAHMKQDEKRSFILYIQFMNDLISTEKDIRLLFKGKRPVIIVSDLENHKAVADMYNCVSKNHFRACNEEWSLIRRDVTKYYESIWFT